MAMALEQTISAWESLFTKFQSKVIPMAERHESNAGITVAALHLAAYAPTTEALERLKALLARCDALANGQEA